MSSSDARTKALFNVRVQTSKALNIAKDNPDNFAYQLSKIERIGYFLTVERITKEVQEVLKYEWFWIR